jgi:glycosyltransferase involved in cell wall biosynthesis
VIVLVEVARVVISTVAVAEPKRFVVVGIPAYNEEKTIAKVVLDALKHADKVVVCDDGSSDMTAEIAESLGAEVIRHETNQGYGAAVRTLFKRARELNADVFVTLDADGQHDPKEISMVVKPIVEDAVDIAVGSRFVSQGLSSGMPLYRKVGVKLITKLTNAGSRGGTVGDAQSGFRAYGRKSMEALELSENGMGLSSQILMDAGTQHLKVCEVPVSIRYDNGVKTSTHNPVRHGVGVVMSIVKLVVEEKSLVLMGIPGVLSLMIGALFGVWMLQIYDAEHHLVTNIALASIAFVLIGFFLLSTSITLYAIARLAQRTNGKK